jgi:hypothetical protein
VTEPSARPARTRRPARRRGAVESLLSIVAILEAVVVFFVTITAYGLRVLPTGVVFGGGVALFLLLVIVSRVIRYPVGLWIGCALQVVLVLLGLLLPIMWVVGGIFFALWTYCLVKGLQLDRRNAHFFTEPTTTQPEE